MATIPGYEKRVRAETHSPDQRSAVAETRSEVAALVRRHDRDRFQTALFVPAARRDALFALYAFNYEIARVRESVSEPTLGLIRLEWWRQSLDAAFEAPAAATPSRGRGAEQGDRRMPADAGLFRGDDRRPGGRSGRRAAGRSCRARKLCRRHFLGACATRAGASRRPRRVGARGGPSCRHRLCAGRAAAGPAGAATGVAANHPGRRRGARTGSPTQASRSCAIGRDLPPLWPNCWHRRKRIWRRHAECEACRAGHCRHCCPKSSPITRCGSCGVTAAIPMSRHWRAVIRCRRGGSQPRRCADIIDRAGVV